MKAAVVHTVHIDVHIDEARGKRMLRGQHLNALVADCKLCAYSITDNEAMQVG